MKEQKPEIIKRKEAGEVGFGSEMPFIHPSSDTVGLAEYGDCKAPARFEGEVGGVVGSPSHKILMEETPVSLQASPVPPLAPQKDFGT